MTARRRKTVPSGSTDKAYARFEKLARKLAQVPKSEIKEASKPSRSKRRR